MAFNPSGMVNPMQFSDLGTITGLDPSLAQPVVPPEFDPTSRVQQAVAPIQAKYPSLVKAASVAMNAVIPGSVETSVPSMSGGYDFGASPHR